MPTAQTTQAHANLYETDLYLWSQTSAQLLKQKRFDELDIENLIEEIQDMGRSEQRSIYSHQLNLIMHLLKWDYQPDARSKSWRFSIRNARLALAKLLRENPSLANLPAENLIEVYSDARNLAADETGISLKAFPLDCPYAIEQVLDNEWLPS